MEKNVVTIEFEALPENQSFARSVAAAYISVADPTVEELTEVKTAVSEAVSNAIKGRLIPDDDQHTLAVALLSTAVQSQECCHITVLPLSDAHDFFSAHSSDYALGNFYFGGWC